MADHPHKRVREAMEPEWNEVREQRVLARIQEARRARPRRSPIVWVFAAAAAVLLVAGVALKLQPKAPVELAKVEAPAPPKLVLADGSEATLTADAHVKVEEQTTDRVTLVQSVGEVRYEVKPNPARRFAVRAGDVTVRVTGTAFTVKLEQKTVRVKVERGSVEVDDGARTTMLVATESIEVAAYRVEPVPAPSTAVEPSDKPVKPAPPSVESLLSKADEARAAHKNDEAAEALRTLVTLYPKDPRVSSALFTLGRVERARGRHAAAAQSFQRCHQVAPHGALAEDALAEEASSWKSAGETAKAKTAASQYLKLYPGGAHVARMMPLTE